jgi:hypothetical protein
MDIGGIVQVTGPVTDQRVQSQRSDSCKGLHEVSRFYLIGVMMKSITLFSIVAACSLALSSMALAAGTKTYQVTGPVLEMNDSMIAVQKGKERWEIARDSSTKVNGDLKVGAKVTITYTMSATEVEVKPEKGAKSSAKKP